MYVVKRSFKNFGETLTAGSVIKDPAGIKRFKSKLTDGKIVEVTEQNFEQYRDYFKAKFGVELIVNEDNGSNENTDNNSSDSDVDESNDENKANNENDDSTSATKTAVTTAKVIAN